MFKLLVLDVDGVMTNGNKIYDKYHVVLAKEFCDTDFTAIKRFVSNGIPVVFLSGDTWNEQMAKVRKIPFYYSERVDGKIDKLTPLKKILVEYQCKPEDCAMMADDMYDFEAMSYVGYKFCPLNAIKEIQSIKDCQIIPRNGGSGAVAYLASLYNKVLPNYPYEI